MAWLPLIFYRIIISFDSWEAETFIKWGGRGLVLVSTAVLRVSLRRAMSGVTEYFDKMPWGHCCDAHTAHLGEPHHGDLP